MKVTYSTNYNGVEISDSELDSKRLDKCVDRITHRLFPFCDDDGEFNDDEAYITEAIESVITDEFGFVEIKIEIDNQST